MFGAFLLVGEQFLGKCEVFFAGCAARAGTGNGVGAGDAILEGDKRLRGGTNDVEGDAVAVFKVEEVHVRRGVGLAQYTVHVEGLGVGFGFESA